MSELLFPVLCYFPFLLVLLIIIRDMRAVVGNNDATVY